MPKIAIVGCGIIGATLAYEFSQLPGWEVVVIDSQSHPAQGSTGAALGLLMGAISHKIKGRAWQMREYSLRYYHHHIPQLQAQSGLSIAHNPQGLVKLLAADDDLSRWQSLAQTRAAQGWPLEMWSPAATVERLPQLNPQTFAQAIYSPADWQVNPQQLVQALVQTATLNGAAFHWQTQVLEIQQQPLQLLTNHNPIVADWIVIAAGLGSPGLLSNLDQQLELVGVLGQALQVRLATPSPPPAFQPVITGNDIHIVPLTSTEFWVGATVEFPAAPPAIPSAQPVLLQDLWQQAITYVPPLANAQIRRTWSGLRPRPVGQPAPIITRIHQNPRLILATGHYRNGILLAPATAKSVRSLIEHLED